MSHPLGRARGKRLKLCKDLKMSRAASLKPSLGKCDLKASLPFTPQLTPLISPRIYCLPRCQDQETKKFLGFFFFVCVQYFNFLSHKTPQGCCSALPSRHLGSVKCISCHRLQGTHWTRCYPLKSSGGEGTNL